MRRKKKLLSNEADIVGCHTIYEIHNDIGNRAAAGCGTNMKNFSLISYPMNPWYNEKKEKSFDCKKKHEKKRYTYLDPFHVGRLLRIWGVLPKTDFSFASNCLDNNHNIAEF